MCVTVGDCGDQGDLTPATRTRAPATQRVPGSGAERRIPRTESGVSHSVGDYRMPGKRLFADQN